MTPLANSLKIVEIEKETEVSAVARDVFPRGDYVIGDGTDGELAQFAERISDQNLDSQGFPGARFVKLADRIVGAIAVESFTTHFRFQRVRAKSSSRHVSKSSANLFLEISAPDKILEL